MSRASRSPAGGGQGTGRDVTGVALCQICSSDALPCASEPCPFPESGRWIGPAPKCSPFPCPAPAAPIIPWFAVYLVVEIALPPSGRVWVCFVCLFILGTCKFCWLRSFVPPILPPPRKCSPELQWGGLGSLADPLDQLWAGLRAGRGRAPAASRHDECAAPL